MVRLSDANVLVSHETPELIPGSKNVRLSKRYDVMTKTTETILAEALQLDAEERAELASELVAGLDGPADPDASSDWTEEIKRRVAGLE